MTNLTAVIIGNPDDDARIPQWREGVVTQVSPLLVRVGSATTAKPCNALGSYVPQVGDAVSVLVLSGDRLVLGSVGTTAWTPLALTAPWRWYGGGWGVPAYRKIGDVVYLRGLLDHDTATIESPATLPVGYRPGTQQVLMQMSSGGGRRIDISPSGSITLSNPSPVSDWLSLDGIIYSTTA